MLILTRRPGETLMIGNDIEVLVVRVRGNQVRFGITAPDHISVDRAEVREMKDHGEEPDPDPQG